MGCRRCVGLKALARLSLDPDVSIASPGLLEMEGRGAFRIEVGRAKTSSRYRCRKKTGDLSPSPPTFGLRPLATLFAPPFIDVLG